MQNVKYGSADEAACSDEGPERSKDASDCYSCKNKSCYGEEREDTSTAGRLVACVCNDKVEQVFELERKTTERKDTNCDTLGKLKARL